MGREHSCLCSISSAPDPVVGLTAAKHAWGSAVGQYRISDLFESDAGVAQIPWKLGSRSNFRLALLIECSCVAFAPDLLPL
jgi:hypothetical protein